jgi:hypothetical protein
LPSVDFFFLGRYGPGVFGSPISPSPVLNHFSEILVFLQIAAMYLFGGLTPISQW